MPVINRLPLLLRHSQGRQVWVLTLGLMLSACAGFSPTATERTASVAPISTTTKANPTKAKAPSVVIDEGNSGALASPNKAPKISRGDINDLALRALDLVNIGYRYGGNSPEEGFDCSGFIHFLFQEQLSVVLPRTTKAMRHEGQSIPKEHLQTGDLVFFNTLGRPFSHVGIYLGDNRFIHAPSKGKNVRIDAMNGVYWVKRFNGARRVVANILPINQALSRNP